MGNLRYDRVLLTNASLADHGDQFHNPNVSGSNPTPHPRKAITSRGTSFREPSVEVPAHASKLGEPCRTRSIVFPQVTYQRRGDRQVSDPPVLYKERSLAL